MRALIDRAKSSPQARVAEAIAGAEEFVPAPLGALSSRMHFWNRFYSLLVSNIPGPTFPLYLLGRRLEELVPVPLLVGEHSLALAILTYDGQATLGLMGDGGGDDLELLRSDLRDSLDQLVRSAGGRPRRRPHLRTNRFKPGPRRWSPLQSRPRSDDEGREPKAPKRRMTGRLARLEDAYHLLKRVMGYYPEDRYPRETFHAVRRDLSCRESLPSRVLVELQVRCLNTP